VKPQWRSSEKPGFFDSSSTPRRLHEVGAEHVRREGHLEGERAREGGLDAGDVVLREALARRYSRLTRGALRKVLVPTT
jgi:hypothetical protein